MLSSKMLEVFILGLGSCALACGQSPESRLADDTSTGSGGTDSSPFGDDEIGAEWGGDGDGDNGETGNGTGNDTGDGDTGGDGDGDTGGDGDGDGDAGDGDGDAEGLCAGPCGTPDCGDCPNAAMADADWFFIDATEVTVADYANFAALTLHPIAMSGECLWKLDVIEGFTPEKWDAQLDDDLQHPVRGVDWCDAEAYCQWAGKRLCGVVGGEAAQLAGFADPDNEWYRACTNGAGLTYPYGKSYKKFACNGADQGVADITPVGVLEDCQGGYAGVFDMSGNLWEWTNACGDDPDTDSWEQDCRRRGGSFFSSKELMRCAVDSRRHRGYRDNNTGIRCCSD